MLRGRPRKMHRVTDKFFIPGYHLPCKTCNYTGAVYFQYAGRHYPNAPCPVCRYKDLMKWTRWWELPIWVHRWLRNQYVDDINSRWKGSTKPRIYRKRHLELSGIALVNFTKKQNEIQTKQEAYTHYLTEPGKGVQPAAEAGLDGDGI